MNEADTHFAGIEELKRFDGTGHLADRERITLLGKAFLILLGKGVVDASLAACGDRKFFRRLNAQKPNQDG